MQHGPAETSQQTLIQNNPDLSDTSLQHGCLHHDPSGPALDSLQQQLHLGSLSPQSVRAGATSGSFTDGVNPEFLEERLRRLNVSVSSDIGRSSLPGQRISEYEKALAPSTPRKALGFKVVRRPDTPSDGVQLSDFPNGTSQT